MEVAKYKANDKHFNSLRYLLIGSKKLITSANLLHILTFTNYLIAYPDDVIGQKYVYKSASSGSQIDWTAFVQYYEDETFVMMYRKKFDYWCDALHLSFFKSQNDQVPENEMLDVLRSWQFLLKRALKEEDKKGNAASNSLTDDDNLSYNIMLKVDDALVESRVAIQEFQAKIMRMSAELEQLDNENAKLRVAVCGAAEKKT